MTRFESPALCSTLCQGTQYHGFPKPDSSNAAGISFAVKTRDRQPTYPGIGLLVPEVGGPNQPT